jgi:hypothetical protein
MAEGGAAGGHGRGRADAAVCPPCDRREPFPRDQIAIGFQPMCNVCGKTFVNSGAMRNHQHPDVMRCVASGREPLGARRRVPARAALLRRHE